MYIHLTRIFKRTEFKDSSDVFRQYILCMVASQAYVCLAIQKRLSRKQFCAVFLVKSIRLGCMYSLVDRDCMLRGRWCTWRRNRYLCRTSLGVIAEEKSPSAWPTSTPLGTRTETVGAEQGRVGEEENKMKTDRKKEERETTEKGEGGMKESEGGAESSSMLADQGRSLANDTSGEVKSTFAHEEEQEEEEDYGGEEEDEELGSEEYLYEEDSDTERDFLYLSETQAFEKVREELPLFS